jgi:threonine dehydrogenase-like Zn-dependent dehydrogenase
MEKEKCWAAVLYGAQDMRFEQVAVPEIGPYDTLIKMQGCVLCGSDLHGYLGRHHRVVYPRILGHEFAGVIEKRGEKVKDFSKGQRVFCDIDMPCGTCDPCRQGRGNICANIKTIGFDVDGAFSEYVKVPSANLYPIPDNLSFEEACLANNFGLAYNAVKRRGEVLLNDKVLIIGCGPIGVCTVILAKSAGANVIIAGNHDYQLEMAKELGADEVINAKKDDTVARTLNFTQGKGVDKVIEIVGGQQDVTLGQCTQAVRRGGLVVIVGTFSGNKATLRATEFKDREISMRGSRSFIGRETLPKVIRLIASGKFNASRLISHRLRLEEVEKGLRIMKNRAENVMKVVISP